MAGKQRDESQNGYREFSIGLQSNLPNGSISNSSIDPDDLLEDDQVDGGEIEAEVEDEGEDEGAEGEDEGDEGEDEGAEGDEVEPGHSGWGDGENVLPKPAKKIGSIVVAVYEGQFFAAEVVDDQANVPPNYTRDGNFLVAVNVRSWVKELNWLLIGCLKNKEPIMSGAKLAL